MGGGEPSRRRTVRVVPVRLGATSVASSSKVSVPPQSAFTSTSTSANGTSTPSASDRPSDCTASTSPSSLAAGSPPEPAALCQCALPSRPSPGSESGPSCPSSSSPQMDSSMSSSSTSSFIWRNMAPLGDDDSRSLGVGGRCVGLMRAEGESVNNSGERLHSASRGCAAALGGVGVAFAIRDQGVDAPSSPPSSPTSSRPADMCRSTCTSSG
mmetsp:Transcript_24767/g.53649  ORF Transcript_24767/g.53649 Transcript_24767/m.53649 type:complete len:212 (+) Transcript_24767:871-1506(+)